jgi:predicted PurR-regulated permease PerM
MPSLPPLSESDQRVIKLAIEIAVRIGVLAVLAWWSYGIARPFLFPILWGVIIAVAVYPGYRRLEARLNGRRLLAATLFTALMLAVLVVPAVLLGGSLASGAEKLAAAFHAGTLQVPPPPERVASWPLVGADLHRFWQLASENLQEAVQQAGATLKQAARWLLDAAAGVALALLEFALAIVIAGVLLAHAEAGGRVTRAIAERLAPERGVGFAKVAEETVRSVATGILGVALLQGVLAGLGFLVAGVPAAGLLTVVCIVLGVIQIGVALVMIPVVIYLFFTADTSTAVAFLVYAILISPLDNILKPLLLGRGVRVPMVVVFIGAIGGFIHAGIIGLFVGAVIFTLGYGLFMAWLYPQALAERAVEPEA